MVCLRNICIDTLHKGDNDDNNNGGGRKIHKEIKHSAAQIHFYLREEIGVKLEKES